MRLLITAALLVMAGALAAPAAAQAKQCELLDPLESSLVHLRVKDGTRCAVGEAVAQQLEQWHSYPHGAVRNGHPHWIDGRPKDAWSKSIRWRYRYWRSGDGIDHITARARKVPAAGYRRTWVRFEMESILFDGDY